MAGSLLNSAYLLPPIAAGIVAFGLFVLVWRWGGKHPSTQIFYLLILSVAIWSLLIFGMRASPDVERALLWDRMAVIPGFAVFVLFYHLTVAYTERRHQTKLVTAGYAILFVLTVLSPTRLVLEGMRVESYGYAPVLGPVAYLLGLIGIVLLAIGISNLLRRYRVSRSYDERNRLLYFLGAGAFPIIGAFVDGFTNLPPVAIWANLALILVCATGIVRHQLLDVRVVIRKGLVYLTVSLVIALPYAGVVYYVQYVLQSRTTPLWLHAFVILLFAFLLRPLYGWAQESVDRLFYRGRYDHLKELQRFIQETQSIVEPVRLGERLVKLVSDALKASSACLLLPSKDLLELEIVACTGQGESLPNRTLRSDSRLVKWLEGRRLVSREELSLVPELQSLPKADQDLLDGVSAELIVPIRSTPERLSGVIILGRKLSDADYSDEERVLLSTLASQMVVNLENVHLYEQAKMAAQALFDSEKKYRELVERLRDVIYVLDENGTVTYVSPSVEGFLGYEASEIIGHQFKEFFEAEEVPWTVESFQSNPSGVPQAGEYRIRTKSGQLRWFYASGQRIMEGSRVTGVQGILSDITERKQAEEREKVLKQELDKTSRLASIGQLAAGVAHEINNPLTGILGFSQRLLRKCTDEGIVRDLNRIHGEAVRAARVVENLLTFARRKGPKKDYVQVNEVIEKALDLRMYELKTSSIQVTTELAPNLPPIMADFQQLQQVLLNIIVNAEQAMTEASGGGALRIRSSQEDDRVVVAFTDSGPGIPEENLQRLFEPFFSTKTGRGGTGLGLSVCHGIISEHNGKIYAESVEGEGATFIVELPIVAP